MAADRRDTCTIELGDRQLTYLQLALKHQERTLREAKGEDIGEELDDLLVVQHLIETLEDVRQQGG